MNVEQRVRATGLLEPGRPVVVLLSGGRDSVCLLHLATAISGSATALHVNYGLREEAAADEALCRDLCERLGVPLHVERAKEPEGNVQAWARDVRYAAAGRLAEDLDADMASAHTATDQVETVLYRLAASPGRRALLGMRERDGRLIRPLLTVPREETAAYCRGHALPWAEDASNEDRTYARNRIRHDLLPVLRSIHPAAEANVLRTLELLRDEADVLGLLVDEALTAKLDELRTLPPALQRLVLQRLADTAMQERSLGCFLQVGKRAEEILALESGQALDLGGGLRVSVSRGELAFDMPTVPASTARWAASKI